MTEIYITTEGGMLVAEVNGKKCYELCDCINHCGFGFGETIEVDYDMDDDYSDIWSLVDAIYDMCEE